MSVKPTPAVYDALVTAYRLLGRPNHVRAAKMAATDAATARVAWEYGWDDDSFPMLPIREQFEREQLLARARRAKASTALIEARELAMDQAADDGAVQRAVEGMAARSTMLAIERMASDYAKLAASLSAVTLPRLQREVERLSAQQDVSAHTLLGLYSRMAKGMHDMVASLEKAQVAERKWMGEPDQTVEITHRETRSADAVKQLKAHFTALMEAAKARALPPPDQGAVVEVISEDGEDDIA